MTAFGAKVLGIYSIVAILTIMIACIKKEKIKTSTVLMLLIPVLIFVVNVIYDFSII